MIGSHRTCCTWRFTGRAVEVGELHAVAASARPCRHRPGRTCRGCGCRIAGTSEATKYSSSPRPITTGGPERAATILFGSSARDHGQREDAGAILSGSCARPLRGSRRPADILFDQVRDDFGVGLGDELVAFALRAAASASGSSRRCRCARRRFRRCSRDADARFLPWGGRAWPSGCGRCRRCRRRRFRRMTSSRLRSFAGGAANLELAVVADDRDTGRVIAAIFQPRRPSMMTGTTFLAQCNRRFRT